MQTPSEVKDFLDGIINARAAIRAAHQGAPREGVGEENLTSTHPEAGDRDLAARNKKGPASQLDLFKTYICRLIYILPLSPLEALPRALLSVLLTLLGAGVAGQIPLLAQQIL